MAGMAVMRFDSAAIDGFLGLRPDPLRPGMPVVVRVGKYGHRTHLAMGPDVEVTACGRRFHADDIWTVRYDLDDERFGRRGWRCQLCQRASVSLGVVFYQ